MESFDEDMNKIFFLNELEQCSLIGIGCLVFGEGPRDGDAGFMIPFRPAHKKWGGEGIILNMKSYIALIFPNKVQGAIPFFSSRDIKSYIPHQNQEKEKSICY